MKLPISSASPEKLTTSSTTTTVSSSTFVTNSSQVSPILPGLDAISEGEAAELNMEPQKTTLDVIYDYDEVEFDEQLVEDKDVPRKRRAADEGTDDVWGKLIPGACVKGCAFGFYAFSIVSSIVNCLGSSGRIGNLLVNYRCVSKQDKSVTQGLILMLISLFALIPGPIMFGRIIDQTCLVWTEQCSGRRGNCQLYDQRRFRYYINLTAFFLTGIGVFFDILVWKYGKNLDLYGDREEEMLKKQQKQDRNGRGTKN